MNAEQQSAFTRIVNACIGKTTERYFYVTGPSGCGSTTLCVNLLNRFRNGLGFAPIGSAAALLPRGTTTHSGFWIPFSPTEIPQEMGYECDQAELLRNADLIIIDEVSLLKHYELEVIERRLRYVMDNGSLFGGKVVVLAGSFRKMLAINASGIKTSPLWRNFTKIILQENMRSAGFSEYNAWLSNLSSGGFGFDQHLVEIPRNFGLKVVNDYDTLIEHVFEGNFDPNVAGKRAILTGRNEDSLAINVEIIFQMPDWQIYFSNSAYEEQFEETCHDAESIKMTCKEIPTRYGEAPPVTMLATGALVMLLHDVQGLTKGTRLVVTALEKTSITARVLSETNRTVTIPIVGGRYYDVQTFPVAAAFAMNIFKAQGQTFDRVGVLLDEPVWAHGQLYVALSRARDPKQTWMMVGDTNGQGRRDFEGISRVFVNNVVDQNQIDLNEID